MKKVVIIFLLVMLTGLFMYSERASDIDILISLQSRNYNQARDLIIKNLPKLSDKAYYSYLLGMAYLNLKDYEKARDVYSKLIEEYPSSGWALKSRYKIAYIYYKQKKYKQAYDIYKKMLSIIGSKKRRSTFSKVYSELGNKYAFNPDKSKRNYSYGVTYFERAIDIGSLKSEDDQLLYYNLAKAYFNWTRYGYVVVWLKKFIKKYPASKINDRVYTLLGEAHFKRRSYVASRKYFKKVIESYPNSKLAAKAAFFLGKSYMPAYARNEFDFFQGIKYLSIAFNKYKDKKYSPLAGDEIGNAYSRKTKFASRAVDAYLLLVKRYPEHEKSADALFAAASSLYRILKDYKRAVFQFKRFINKYPNHRLWRKARSEIAGVDYRRALDEYKLKNYDLAYKLLDSYVSNYPLTSSRVYHALYLKGEIRFKQKKYREAVNEYENLFKRNPSNSYAVKGIIKAAEIYIDNLEEFDKGIKTLEKIKHYSYRHVAARMIKKLKSPYLKLSVKKHFLTSQTPELNVEMRNTKEVKINLYKINLLDYFYKYNSLKGVENLDILLIKPDKSFTKKIDAYKKIKKYKISYTLTGIDAGAYVVQLVSKTKTATALLIKGDVSLTLVASKNELLVHAKNLITKSGQKGCEIFVSNGSKIILKAKTGDRGFYFKKLKKLYETLAIEPGSLSVLIKNKESYSWTNLNMAGVSSDTGVSSRVYVFQNKPVYKPGDKLSFKAVIRQVKSGKIEVPDEKDFNVKLYSASGNLIYDKDTRLNAFGSINGSILLDSALAAGSLRLVISSNDGKISYSKSIEIKKYITPENVIEITKDKASYFPGDKIRLKIKVLNRAMLPYKNVGVNIRSSISKYKSVKTNKKGIAYYTLDTSKASGKRIIWVVATLPDGNYKRMQIALSPYSAKLKIDVPNRLFIEEEKITLKVFSTDPNGKKISVKGILKLSRTDNSLEAEVLRKPFTTLNGAASIVLNKLKGGAYKIEAYLTGTKIIAKRALTHIKVSGKKDKLSKIFILNNEKKAKSGGIYNLKLYSRLESDSTGLIVISSEKILSFKETKIKPGLNNIKLSLPEKYSPRVKIKVLVSNVAGAYKTSKALKVVKGLNIKIAGLKKRYLPGARVSFKLSSLNQRGEERTSEVAVAVINSEFLSRNNIKIEDIAKFFKTKPNLALFRDSQSLPFNYAGSTRNRSREVLAENALRIADASQRDNQNRPDDIFSRASASAPSPALAQRSRRRGYYGGRYERDRYRRPAGGAANGSREGADADERPALEEAPASGLTAPQIRKLFRESAYFNPSVKLTPSGEVKFTLPDNIAKWKIILIGLSNENTFSTKAADITAAKKVFVSLKTPISLSQGDIIKASATVYNSLKESIDTSYTISLRQGNDSRSSRGRVRVGSASDEMISASDRVVIKSTQDAVFSASASGDTETRTVPVRAWTRYKVKGVSGHTNRSIIRYINLPEGYAKKELVINIYPHTIRFLESLGKRGQAHRGVLTSGAASDLIQALSHYNIIKTTLTENNIRVKRAKERIKQSILNAYNYLSYNGEYTWIRHRPLRDDNTTILMFHALSYAKKSGFKIDKSKMDKSVNYLMGLYRTSRSMDKRAAILWAISSYKNIDFSYLNSLYRIKSSLSSSGLSFLAMAFLNEKRLSEADNIFPMIIKRRKGLLWNRGSGRSDFMLATKAEVSAVVLNALTSTGRHNNVVKTTVKRLMEETETISNPSTYFAAFFSKAFSNYLLKYNTGNPSSCTITFKVNGSKVYGKKMSPLTGVIRQKLALRGLKDKNKVEIIIDGSGNFSYSVYISYFKPGQVYANVSRYGKIKKEYLYPDYTSNGKKIKRGFRTAEVDYSQRIKTQKLIKVSKAQVFKARLKINLKGYKENYFILKDYIPAGTYLAAESVKGNFVYFRQNGNELIFYIKKKRYGSVYRINYELISVFEGKFRALPPVLHPLSKPDKEITGNVLSIEIENENYNTFRDYIFSPDELYNIGKLLYDKKKYAHAYVYLKKLLDKYNLRDYYLKKAAEMMLFISMKKKSYAEVVKYFDILRERNPDLNLSLEQVEKIAESYAKIGEYERAMLLTRDLIEAYFSQESQLGAVLLKAKLLDKSIKVMNDIFKSYPDTNNVKAVYYGFGQELYNYFTSLSPVLKKGDKGYGIYKRARDIFVNFLSEYPDYVNADEVSFTFLNLLLDKKRYTDLYNASTLFAKRYPNSKYVADYKYLSAYSLYELGRFKEALSFAKEVAYKKFPSPSGTPRYSKNKDFATHMLAKIYHALGRMGEAIKEYRKVASKFADAKHSLEFLKRKNIIFPEVSRFKLNDDVSVKINTKGIGQFELKVYKVDFVILCLSRNNLSNMRNVNLAGIRPEFFKKVKINSTADDIASTKVKIPVSGKGAYLVVVKSNELETSGIVLLSDIRADVQAYEEGRVRALIRNAKGKRLSGVKMYYRGTGMSSTRRGESDARGISESNSISGIPIVFGEYNGNYIFYRGNFRIGASSSSSPSSTSPVAPRRFRKQDVLRNILRKRRAIQSEQQRLFNENTGRNIRQYKIRDLMN